MIRNRYTGRGEVMPMELLTYVPDWGMAVNIAVKVPTMEGRCLAPSAPFCAHRHL